MIKWNGKTLEWPDIWNHLKMGHNSKGKWFIGDDTQQSVIDFLNDFGYTRTDIFGTVHKGTNKSHLSTILLYNGFAKYLVQNEPEIALKIGIAYDSVDTTQELIIHWLNDCPCCNHHLASVTTISSNPNYLFENDDVKCIKCGHTGKIEMISQDIVDVNWDE